MRRTGAVLVSLAAAALLAACGAGSATSNPPSRLTAEQAKAPLTNVAEPLQDLRAQANSLLSGGRDAFEARLQELRGLPVVINAWASWCGPCRHEFPFFQSQAAAHGNEIAFLGVDVADSDAAAKTFLKELPLPYPSYSDPGSGVGDAEIAKSLDVGPGLPNTIFLDREGNVVYHWRGGYANEQDLAEQVERYAR